jgi:glycine cleavage system H protein
MNVPEGLFYTKEHEWIKIYGKMATIGITDHAQHSLGDITFVELPKVGTISKQFKQIATVESVKAASDVYAPMSGKIIKINEEIKNDPAIINHSPYEKGWFIVIDISSPDEKNNLLTSSRYSEYLKEL